MGGAYYKWKERLYSKEWVVYTKPPFGGAKYVVKYLATYSHRLAITNTRIKVITLTHVIFNYKNYKAGGQHKKMTHTEMEFLQRFCLHILPSRFRKIRHYGFLSNASKKKCLDLARRSLQVKQSIQLTKVERKELALQRLFKNTVKRYPSCQ